MARSLRHGSIDHLMQWPDEYIEDNPTHDSTIGRRKTAPSQTKRKGRKNRSDIVDLRVPVESTENAQTSSAGPDLESGVDGGEADDRSHLWHQLGPRGATREVWGRKEREGLATLEELFSESVSLQTLVSVSVSIGENGIASRVLFSIS